MVEIVVLVHCNPNTNTLEEGNIFTRFNLSLPFYHCSALNGCNFRVPVESFVIIIIINYFY